MSYPFQIVSVPNDTFTELFRINNNGEIVGSGSCPTVMPGHDLGVVRISNQGTAHDRPGWARGVG